MTPRRIAGTARLHQRIRELLDEVEWQRRLSVIVALLPYSGTNRRPPPVAGPVPWPQLMPRQRRRLPSEPRLVAGAVAAAHPHVRRGARRA
ncbi:MAG: hypothetical protein L0K86_06320 [Actinomycetia bacterium]|nr:hypothetical protein [Actinomycetes bacterium]